MFTARNALKAGMEERIICGSEDFADELRRTYELKSLTKPKGRLGKNGEKGGLRESKDEMVLVIMGN